MYPTAPTTIHLNTTAPIRREKPLILTVDDEPCISRVIQLKLQNAGYEVVRAASGLEGYEKFIALQPDVIITDVRMPGMSGLELCARCEEHRAEWPFLIVLLSSQLDDELRSLVATAVKKYLPKPFSPKEVLQTVREYIAFRSSGQREDTVQ